MNYSSLIKLPTPSSISYLWNFGSILGLNLAIQILTGLLMTMYYIPALGSAFDSVNYICMEVNYGWILRFVHANGATAYFFFIYLHLARGLYFKSFLKSTFTWMSGVTIYLLFMMTAFLGYVLPWGQMSYWGATVITNLMSAIPYFGAAAVEWVWGGFSVSGPTLTRFFSLHYLMPLAGVVFIMVHLLLLHETGSSNPLGLGKNTDKIFFHPFFMVKDLLGFGVFLFAFLFIVLKYPLFFLDPDNWVESNPMTTPVHIKPEWYFLFAYAILRSVPNKLGGVMCLVMSIFILYILPLFSKKMKSTKYSLTCAAQFTIFVLLTFLGAMTVEYPFLFLGMASSFLYFLNLSILMMV